MTTPTPNRPPLWRLMAEVELDALMAHPHFLSDAAKAAALAAVILAMRDWLLPEQSEPQPGDRYEQRHIIWRHNQRLRAQLTAEADRAERGDG